MYQACRRDEIRAPKRAKKKHAPVVPSDKHLAPDFDEVHVYVAPARVEEQTQELAGVSADRKTRTHCDIDSLASCGALN